MRKLTLRELAEITGTELKGNPDVSINGVNSLIRATEGELSFLENPRYETQVKRSNASAVIVPSYFSTKDLSGNFLFSDSPSAAFQKAIECFQGPTHSGFEGVHPTAVIHPSIRLPTNCSIGPHAVIDRECQIGEGVVIGAGTFVGAECQIGENTHLYPNVTVREKCSIGKRVIIQPGAVIGSCGFGYYTNMSGEHEKYAHYGTVVIEDDVEIGANTTIDRGRFAETRIRRGSKLDNLVQIAHQVEVGECNLLASQTGIAGSTRTGKYVVMGGKCGVAGHIDICDKAIFGATSAVSKSIKEPGAYMGIPAIPILDFKDQIAGIRKLKLLREDLKKLKQKVEELEKQHTS